MAVLYLQFINAVAKRTRVIQGDAGELATSTVTSTATGLVATGAFTDSGRQTEIDLMLQVSNEAFHEVFGLGLFPNEAASATIALVDGQREYEMPSDFERFAGRNYHDRVFRGATTGLLISEYRGGYARMLRDQPIATDYTGLPDHWALSPVNGSVRFDREPTSEEDGWTYNVLYEKRLSYTSTMATESLPFSDTVADALVPVVAEGWNAAFKNEFNTGLFQTSIARAVDHLTRSQRKARYGKR